MFCLFLNELTFFYRSFYQDLPGLIISGFLFLNNYDVRGLSLDFNQVTNCKCTSRGNGCQCVCLKKLLTNHRYTSPVINQMIPVIFYYKDLNHHVCTATHPSQSVWQHYLPMLVKTETPGLVGTAVTCEHVGRPRQTCDHYQLPSRRSTTIWAYNWIIEMFDLHTHPHRFYQYCPGMKWQKQYC